MFRRLLIIALFCTLPLSAAWEKQGTLNGNITDVEIITWDGPPGLIFVSTDGSGVFASVDPDPGSGNWAEANGYSGANFLPDLNVIALAKVPGKQDWLVAATPSGVFQTENRGNDWYSISNGLVTEGLIPMPTDIDTADISGDLVYYLATAGHGVFRKINSGAWQPYNSGIAGGDMYINCIGAEGTRAVAGTQFLGGEQTGTLYQLDYAQGLWDAVSTVPPRTTWLSVDFTDFNLVIVGAGYSDSSKRHGGAYYAEDAKNFYPLCPVSGQPDEPFFAVAASLDPLGKYLLAGSSRQLYTIPFNINTETCNGNYIPFSFRGKVTGVDIGYPDPCLAVFGGPGKGPFVLDSCSPGSRPVATRDGITDFQINDIAPSPQFNVNDRTLFTGSRIAGIYKNTKPIVPCSDKQEENGYFTRMVGDPDSLGTPDILCVEVSPRYTEGASILYDGVSTYKMSVYAGTNGQGVLVSHDGGRSWGYANGTAPDALPGGAVVMDIAFYDTGDYIEVFAAVYGVGVFSSMDGGQTWEFTASMSNPFVTSLTVDPDGDLFAGCRGDGASRTLFRYVDKAWLERNTTVDIRSLTSAKVDADKTYVFIGTGGSGIYSHLIQGTAVDPFNNGLNGSEFVPDIDASRNFEVGGYNRQIIAAIWNRGAYYYDFTQDKWVEYQKGGSSGLPDRRVTSVAFSPDFGNKGMVFAGHVNQKLFMGYMTDYQPDCSFKEAAGFFTTPEKINGVAVSPTDPFLTLAATEDMGVFISEDGGYTYRPWSKGLYTSSGADVFVVDRILSVALTDPYSGDDIMALAGTDGEGIFYVGFDPAGDVYFPSWTKADPWLSTPPAAGAITEIRYDSLSEDIRASDSVNGDWRSADMGQTWDSMGGAYGFTDIAYMLSGGRGISSFTWGASTGVARVKRDPCSDKGMVSLGEPYMGDVIWHECGTSGLNTCSDFRAVIDFDNPLVSSGGTVLLGARGVGDDFTTWTGIYRSDNARANCAGATWTPSDTGLCSDNPGDMPEVYAFQVLPDGSVLAALEDSDNDGCGGIWMSDATSYGRAWVPVNSGFSDPDPGALDLLSSPDGSRLYTGMSEDGIYADDTSVTFTGYPEPMFQVSSSPLCTDSISQPCDGEPVYFCDYSAGGVRDYWDGGGSDAYDWNFGDGYSGVGPSPSHIYYNSGSSMITRFPNLTVDNGYHVSSSSYTKTLWVYPQLSVDIGMQKDDSIVKLYADFETGLEGFTTTGLWHRDDLCSSVSWDMWFGDDATCSYDTGVPESGYLFSPWIDLTSESGTISLSFDYFLQTENYSGYDLARVIVDDGSGYTEIDTDSANGGGILVDAAWHSAVYDISAFTGKTIRIGYSFNSIDEVGNDYEGWHVDHILVEAFKDLVTIAWTEHPSATGYRIYASSAPSGWSYESGQLDPAMICVSGTCTAEAPASYTFFRIQPLSTVYICDDGVIGGDW